MLTEYDLLVDLRGLKRLFEEDRCVVGNSAAFNGILTEIEEIIRFIRERTGCYKPYEP